MSEDNLFIESINIRIEDSSNGEGYYYTLTNDRGDWGFYQEEPPTKISDSLYNQINEIYKIKQRNQSNQ